MKIQKPMVILQKIMNHSGLLRCEVANSRVLQGYTFTTALWHCLAAHRLRSIAQHHQRDFMAGMS